MKPSAEFGGGLHDFEPEADPEELRPSEESRIAGGLANDLLKSRPDVPMVTLNWLDATLTRGENGAIVTLDGRLSDVDYSKAEFEVLPTGLISQLDGEYSRSHEDYLPGDDEVTSHILLAIARARTETVLTSPERDFGSESLVILTSEESKNAISEAPPGFYDDLDWVVLQRKGAGLPGFVGSSEAEELARFATHASDVTTADGAEWVAFTAHHS